MRIGQTAVMKMTKIAAGWFFWRATRGAPKRGDHSQELENRIKGFVQKGVSAHQYSCANAYNSGE